MSPSPTLTGWPWTQADDDQLRTLAAAGERCGLQPVDEVDDVIEPTTGPGPNAAAGNGDGKMGFAGTGPADGRRMGLEPALVGSPAHRQMGNLSRGPHFTNLVLCELLLISIVVGSIIVRR